MNKEEVVRYLALILSVVAILASGCASQSYHETKNGTFAGALDVRWVKNDHFLFIPNEDNPLTFTRNDGQVIHPGIMYTDGGSIPRFLWGVKGLSPWGYAPAYIVHDWLFVAKHCNYEPDNTYDFHDSVKVMAESLKAVMESDPSVRDYFAFDSIVAAVGSPIAERLWDKGECKELATTKSLVSEPLGELLMTIEYK